MTTISITHHGYEHTTQVGDYVGLEETIDAFCNLLVCAGWAPLSVERGILEKAEAIECVRNPPAPTGMTEDEEMDDPS